MTSSAVIMPRSPWLASAAWTKKAGVPVEAKVAAILRPIWPDLPSPVTISAALGVADQVGGGGEGGPRSDCRAAVSAVMPLRLGIERAQGRLDGGISGSVPDDFAISGFGLAMSDSEGDGHELVAASPP